MSSTISPLHFSLQFYFAVVENLTFSVLFQIYITNSIFVSNHHGDFINIKWMSQTQNASQRGFSSEACMGNTLIYLNSQ